jgi:NAD(P)-dependent dehydrogenase (short-subunit alcohol dehydrogenase family)
MATVFLTMDVDSDRSIEECFAAIHGRGEEIDVLVNNAGIERDGSIEECCGLSRADQEGPWHGSRLAGRRFARRLVDCG